MSGAPAASLRKARWPRESFARFVPIQTRWDDNDVFGHVNNVKYYAFFDTAITRIEIEAGIFNTGDSPIVPYTVESNCTYFSGVAFPQALEVGIAVDRVGSSSIAYRLGVFAERADEPSAQGHFIHVYVDRQSGRPVALPPAVRTFAEALTR